MIKVDSNDRPESKMYSYFDAEMDIRKSETPSMQSRSVCFKIPCRHSTPLKCTVELFLMHNPWTNYTPVSGYGYSDNCAGFIFRDCIVCGKNRFPKDFLYEHLACFESPIDCRKPECNDVLTKLQFGDEPSMNFFFAVWGRDAKFLKHHSGHT